MSPSYMVCGCATGQHKEGCALGAAETIAVEAADAAAANGRHELVAALTALVEAKILLDLTGGEEDLLLGVLDELWQCGLIAGSRAAVPS